MNKNKGWIKLYRTLEDKGYYKNSKYVHLWVHILLRANHKNKEFMWNDKIINVKEGQFITGRKQLSSETGLAQSTIEKILKMFEKEHQIEQQKTNKFRLITVLKWNEYQVKEQQKEQQMDNRVTTDGQQMDTNKNVKNDKNEKNYVADKKIYEEILEWFIRLKEMGYANITSPSGLLKFFIRQYGWQEVNRSFQAHRQDNNNGYQHFKEELSNE